MTSSPTFTLPSTLVLGTRGSDLALAQAELTLAALRQAYPTLEVAVRKITTSGDQKHDMSLIKQTPSGAKGLFTKELEEALLRREIDVAVHSGKDMPGTMPEGLVLCATLPRAKTADVLISREHATLAQFPAGAAVGTSSVRRARQLLHRRPDLVLEEIRGNVPTRLSKLRASQTLEGTVLAQAGLERLGYKIEGGILEFEGTRFHAEILEHLPAISQGAIALQCRAEDAPLFAAVNHQPTWLAVRAERELMRLLQGDCTLPVGVATEQNEGEMRMRVILFDSTDAAPLHADVSGSAADPEAVAAEAFKALKSGH